MTVSRDPVPVTLTREQALALIDFVDGAHGLPMEPAARAAVAALHQAAFPRLHSLLSVVWKADEAAPEPEEAPGDEEPDFRVEGQRLFQRERGLDVSDLTWNRLSVWQRADWVAKARQAWLVEHHYPSD